MRAVKSIVLFLENVNNPFSRQKICAYCRSATKIKIPTPINTLPGTYKQIGPKFFLKKYLRQERQCQRSPSGEGNCRRAIWGVGKSIFGTGKNQENEL